MQRQLAASCALLGVTVGFLLPSSRGASPVSAKCQAALDQYSTPPIAFLLRADQFGTGILCTVDG